MIIKINKTPTSFEDNYKIIQEELRKRKHKWHLDAICWMDFDDVCAMITSHIYKKWSKFDQSKPLLPWINMIINHQISNLLRNLYGNYSRPCLHCDACQSENGCKIYETQCSKCPLYLDWEKKKKDAYSIKLPVSMEHHSVEMDKMQSNYIDVDLGDKIKNAHIVMKKYLKPHEYKVYHKLFILQKDEAVVIKELNYEGKPNRCKMLFNIKKSIIDKFKELIQKGIIEM